MRSLHRPIRPRVAAGALLVLAVMLAHGLLWQALRMEEGSPGLQAPVRPQPQTVWLRPSPVAPQGAAPAAPEVPAPAAKPRPPPPRAVAAASPAAELPTPVLPPTAPATAELPVYATRLPTPTRLHYQLQRGGSLGSGTLDWQRDGADYALRLQVQWPGQPEQGSASRGQVDADGVAPLRHAELRRAREVRAVNFQREAALITFSGPQGAYALPPGAQDRLSWMIQLAAVVEADALLARAGAVITLFVAGTRGDAEAWRFEVLGYEPLQLPAGAVPQALQLRREPTRPYDTRVEVWLDPQRQHLPVRAVITPLPGGQPLSLELAAGDAALENDPAAPR